jgi:hypothetical protein
MKILSRDIARQRQDCSNWYRATSRDNDRIVLIGIARDDNDRIVLIGVARQ